MTLSTLYAEPCGKCSWLLFVFQKVTDSSPGTAGIRDVLTSSPSSSPSLFRLVLGDRNVPSDLLVEVGGGSVEQCEESSSVSKSLEKYG